MTDMADYDPRVAMALESGLGHHRAGRLAEAEAVYRRILQENPRCAEALHLLGVLASQVGRGEAAAELIRQALAIRPNFPEALNNLGKILRDLGRLEEAIGACRAAIEANPRGAEAYSNLGVALQEKGLAEEAIAAHRQALALRPDFAEAHFNLGVALASQGRLEEAVEAYGRAIGLNPRLADAYHNIGNARREQGRVEEAIGAYREAVALKPDYHEAWSNLGLALREKGRIEEAIAAWRRAIAVKPEYDAAWCNLGVALREQGQLDEAVAALRRAVELKPDGAEAVSNLGLALGDEGRQEDAIAAFRRAVARNPNLPAVHSNLLFYLNYQLGHEGAAMAEEHRRWNRRHAEPLKQFIWAHDNERDPERRLRIGYVSPDFRGHAAAALMLPLMANHDHARVEVYGYAEVARPDAMTERFRGHADQWRNTAGWPDERMAEEIRKDRIDILVDLAGHTLGNRLLVFARKPAPVQVTWLGYPGTTGLEAMDYRLTDAYADPPGGSDALYSERLIRLPRTNWAYQPSEAAAATAVGPLAAGGVVTFGCFNNFAKVTEGMLRLWAEILAAVPGSRILLKARALGTASVEARVRALFGARGIAAERVEICGWRSSEREHLELYQRLAIALDPFPYHGTVTTCEALWMGVPVVTLAGQTHVSRVGVSLLSSVGLAELAARSEEEYVRTAARLAMDRPRLTELRGTLRPRMAASPLLDHGQFARDMEGAYRGMWRTWCGSAA
jgi:protein O-GlcNAc transferase